MKDFSDDTKSLSEMLDDLSKNISKVNKFYEKKNNTEIDDMFKEFGLYLDEMNDAQDKEVTVDNIRMAVAAKLLRSSMKDVVENSRTIGEILYYKNPKTGDAIIVGDENNVLYADASVPWISHLEAYENGNRTPIEVFDDFE